MKIRNRRLHRVLWGAAVSLSMALALQPAPALASDDRLEANQIVERAQLTLQNFLCDDNMGAFRDLAQRANAILIVPALLKGAFIVGGSGGTGVLMVRHGDGDAWSGPAFYTVGGASIGLQIGGQSSEVVLLAMTDRGVKSFMDNSFKLGADAGVAAGPIGMGASAATANLSADILSFSRSKGLYGGISLDGSVVAVRDSLNRAYYREGVSPAEILTDRAVTNPHARGLARWVADLSSGTVAAASCDGFEKGG
jgi:lipid-binding SYLF domain-containing protein